MTAEMNKTTFSEPVGTQAPVIRIVYGTHTGNSQMLSRDASALLEASGFQAEVCDMEDLNPVELPELNILLLIVSTDGEGEVPLMAEDLFDFLNKNKNLNLTGLHYSVLALGDETYTYFCKAGRDFDCLLEQRGAQRLVERVDCDVDFEEEFETWINAVIRELKNMYVVS